MVYKRAGKSEIVLGIRFVLFAQLVILLSTISSDRMPTGPVPTEFPISKYSRTEGSTGYRER